MNHRPHLCIASWFPLGPLGVKKKKKSAEVLKAGLKATFESIYLTLKNNLHRNISDLLLLSKDNCLCFHFWLFND